MGYGDDVSINELAQLVARTFGFQGCFVHDRSKPWHAEKTDGQFPTTFDGLAAKISLTEGIRSLMSGICNLWEKPFPVDASEPLSHRGTD